MTIEHVDIFRALAAPFRENELKSRSQGGRQLHYITARTAMNRLDSVLGPANWWDRFVPGEKSVLCELTIRLPDGSTLTKSDAGGYAGMADSGDDDKSGYSDAFKRAAVKFGVARYLYGDGVPDFVHTDKAVQGGELQVTPAQAAGGNGSRNGRGSNGNGRGQWGAARPAEQPAPAAPASNGDKAPTTGKALFAWTKDQEQRYSVGLLKYLNSWAKLQDFPGRMVDWDKDQVNLAYAEARRKLQSIESQEVQYEEAYA